jgi:hypothetical protein
LAMVHARFSNLLYYQTQFRGGGGLQIRFPRMLLVIKSVFGALCYSAILLLQHAPDIATLLQHSELSVSTIIKRTFAFSLKFDKRWLLSFLSACTQV